jgi:hypothetical protein
MTIEDELIPALCNESTYCKSIGCTRAQQMRGPFDGTMSQCRRLFLNQATVACVLGPTWMVILLVAVQDENTYDETLKERAYDESDSSLPR